MDIVTYALCKKLAKSAISGIKNLTVNGLDLIIETNDGNKFTMTFPKPADGLDGKDGNSVVSIKIDNNNHLICTMSDETTIDAGEIKGIGGGLIQANKVSQFPTKGKDDTLYLSKEDNGLYYWDGISYAPIVSNTVEIFAKLETAAIEFDAINYTFDLPVDKVAVNVYVNGMYLTEDIDYTIDRTVTPNQITFTELYEEWEICSITYLKPVSGGDAPDTDLDYATTEDIDKLFENMSDIEIPDSKLDYATEEDINNLFKEGNK